MSFARELGPVLLASAPGLAAENVRCGARRLLLLLMLMLKDGVASGTSMLLPLQRPPLAAPVPRDSEGRAGRRRGLGPLHPSPLHVSAGGDRRDANDCRQVAILGLSLFPIRQSDATAADGLDSAPSFSGDASSFAAVLRLRRHLAGSRRRMSVSATSSGSLLLISRPHASPSGSPSLAEQQLQQQQRHDELSGRTGTCDAIAVATSHSGPAIARADLASLRVGSTTSSCEDTGTPLPSTPAVPGVPSEPWLASLARPERPSRASNCRGGDDGEASPSLLRSPVALATLKALSAPPAMLRPRGLSEASGIIVDMARRLGAVDAVVPIVRPASRVGATPRPGTATGTDALSDVAYDALPSASALRAVAAAVLVGYRPVPFHNWRHGFDVAHCAFTLVASGAAAAAALGPVDRLAALLGALAHDVDHPGHTNGFEVGGMEATTRVVSDRTCCLPLLQVNSLSDLALTYNNQSVLEHHHAATLFRILLNTPFRTLATTGSRRPEQSSQAVSEAPEGRWPAQPATDSASGAEPRNATASTAPPALLLPACGRRRQPPPVHNALGLSRQLFTQVSEPCADMCLLKSAWLHTLLLAAPPRRGRRHSRH